MFIFQAKNHLKTAHFRDTQSSSNLTALFDSTPHIEAEDRLDLTTEYILVEDLNFWTTELKTLSVRVHAPIKLSSS